MDLIHSFPAEPVRDEAAPVEFAVLTAGLATLAALSPTGRAQARLDGGGGGSGAFADGGLAAHSVAATGRPVAPQGGERPVHHGGLAGCQPINLLRTPPSADPTGGPVRPRERP